MLKTTVLLLAFVHMSLHVPAGHTPPAGPATEPNPAYPLHVRILSAERQEDHSGVHGSGRGDLLGPQPLGFDYTYICETGFLHNASADEFYQARWKKQDQKMEFLLQPLGSTHIEKCDVNVTMKTAPYGKYTVKPTN